MGRADDLGAVEPRRLADLAPIDIDTLPFTPLNDLARQSLTALPGFGLITRKTSKREF